VSAELRRLALAALILLAACGQDSAPPKPLEPDANSIAYFCHMSLTEHEGPKGQAFLKGQDQPIWFASVGEVFVYLQSELVQTHDLRALYVNDMGQGSWEHPAAGAWIDAHKAIYVIGSSRMAAMGGKEAVPFSSREAAESFIRSYGGEIGDFAAAARALSLDSSAKSN
jgi:copper chaperone NosL